MPKTKRKAAPRRSKASPKKASGASGPKRSTAAAGTKRAGWRPAQPAPAEKTRARRIHRALAKAYPEARCALNFTNPLELYVATVLSAQCTDARVNKVTPSLFATFRTAEDYAAAKPSRLEKMIQSTGFFRNKTRMIQAAARTLVEDFGGVVPSTMDELLTLPGVGRKTANVILGNAFDTPGITVDTHVRRLSQRLGLTRENDPDRIEQDLMLRIQKKEWTMFSHRMIFHGRSLCTARNPKCEVCPVRKYCPYPQAVAGKPAARGSI